MATLTFRAMKGGQPLQGANVYALYDGGQVEDVTDVNGEVNRTVAEDWGPKLMLILVTVNGSGVGGGPYLLKRDVPLVMEL